jgi:hypothetical protein
MLVMDTSTVNLSLTRRKIRRNSRRVRVTHRKAKSLKRKALKILLYGRIVSQVNQNGRALGVKDAQGGISSAL